MVVVVVVVDNNVGSIIPTLSMVTKTPQSAAHEKYRFWALPNVPSLLPWNIPCPMSHFP